MTPYITEILAKINKDPSLLSKEFKDHYVIRTLIQYSFDTRFKMELPEGTPPFKPDTAPLGMSPANFYQQVKKLYVFLRKDLQPSRREQLFIQLLEGIHPEEAAVLVAVKDQNLTSLYPNITADFVLKEGLVEEANLFRPSQATQKEGRKLVVSLSDAATTKESFGKPPAETVAQMEAQTPEVTQEPVKRGRGRPRKNA